LSNHGRSHGQTKQFWPDLVGFKYKMSNLQAAIGCAQMERIDELTSRKREIMVAYREKLAGLTGISMNPEPEGTFNGAWMPTMVFAPETGITREKLQGAFAAENVDARVFFWPLSCLPMFEDKASNVVSWDIPNRAINLPSYHEINGEEIMRVIHVIENITQKSV
jgi:perosamine synthetase